MSSPVKYCPHCGRPVDEGQRFCPHCGSEQPPLPMLGGGSEPAQTGRLLLGAAWADVGLGFLTFILSVMLFGIGMLLSLLLYFVLRSTYPAYARGIGYGLLLVAVLLLGLLAVCLVGITGGRLFG